MKALLILCTCPDSATAERIAVTLVEEGFAACVNQISGVASTYVWDDKVCTDDEVLLLIKTTTAAYAALEARVLELHPYEVPELIAMPIERGHVPYLDWLCDAVEATSANEERPKRS